MKKMLMACVMLCFATSGYAANYLDTQYGANGLEVHLLKVNVMNETMTIAFAEENASGSKMGLAPMNIGDVFYTTKDKKYPVLKDANKKWLASTMVRGASNWGVFTTGLNVIKTIDSGKQEVGWIKFEAPAEGDWPVELTLPGVTPFVLEKPTGKEQ